MKDQLTEQIKALFAMALKSSEDATQDSITESIIDSAGHLMAARRLAAQIGTASYGSSGTGSYAAGASS